MEILFLLLIIPLLATAAVKHFKPNIQPAHLGASLVASAVMVSVVFFVGKFGQGYDTEILNGQITSKQRIHDEYEESYEVCSGSGKNQTCHTEYETHYTVDWIVNSTVGQLTLDSLDSTWRSVYNEPDPGSYKRAYVGEPFATEHSYMNYIKAAPESLFNNEQHLIEGFDKLIPAYPQVHSHYKVNHVLSPGVALPDYDKWNEYLAHKLKTIGGSKQANIIVILAGTSDQTYRYALENKWLGGKKNDIIVLIGVSEYPKIDWVDTITIGSNAGNELMTVVMRDELTKLNTVADYKQTLDVVTNTVVKHFDRKPMQEYEYLEDSIEVDTWVLILAIILGVAVGVGLMLYFAKQTRSYGYRPRRSTIGNRFR